MNAKTLNKTKNVVDYIAFIVNNFAEHHNLTIRQSFDYLNQYGGLNFLDKHYEFEHCENPLITLQTLQRICSREGGKI